MESDRNSLSLIGAVALDLDYTLFDTTEWTLAALRHACQKRGLNSHAVDQAIERYLADNSEVGPDIYNAVLLDCLVNDSGANIKALHDATLDYDGRGREWELYPGVEEALTKLSHRYRLALIADGPVEVQKAKVNALGLRRFMRCVVYSDSIDGIRSRRPDPRPFRELRDQLELPSNQILFVGDQPARDFKTPRFLGFATCRVFTGPYREQHYPDSESRAQYETTSLARLPELLAVPTMDVSSYQHLPFLKQPESEVAAAAQQARPTEVKRSGAQPAAARQRPAKQRKEKLMLIAAGTARSGHDLSTKISASGAAGAQRAGSSSATAGA